LIEFSVETQGLSKNFAEIRAVKNLTLSVSKGEMFSIVGPDGAGKTTTIRMLCGIIQPSSGRAKIMGYDVGTEMEEVKKHIGYLSQKFTLYGDLTVDENIEFFAEIHQVKNYRKRRDEILEFTRLQPFRRRPAENLSGGMKQKLALACTLIHTPDVLLLDEPTTGVDVVSRRDLWKILSSLLKVGITIIMTTPYLDEAERCSRVALMSGGALMMVDTPQNIKASVKEDIIEIVTEDIRKAFSLLKKMAMVKEAQAFGDRVNIMVQDEEKDFPLIKAQLEKEGLAVTSWRQVPPSLENVFILVTRPRPSEENLKSGRGAGVDD
jgi:ABC-2 type transport system ATP-binding protein